MKILPFFSPSFPWGFSETVTPLFTSISQIFNQAMGNLNLNKLGERLSNITKHPVVQISLGLAILSVIGIFFNFIAIVNYDAKKSIDANLKNWKTSVDCNDPGVQTASNFFDRIEKSTALNATQKIYYQNIALAHCYFCDIGKTLFSTTGKKMDWLYFYAPTTTNLTMEGKKIVELYQNFARFTGQCSFEEQRLIKQHFKDSLLKIFNDISLDDALEDDHLFVLVEMILSLKGDNSNKKLVSKIIDWTIVQNPPAILLNPIKVAKADHLLTDPLPENVSKAKALYREVAHAEPECGYANYQAFDLIFNSSTTSTNQERSEALDFLRRAVEAKYEKALEVALNPATNIDDLTNDQQKNGMRFVN